MENWSDEIKGKVTVCDREGKIIYINKLANEKYINEGDDLLGKNLLDCHPEPSRTKVASMLESPTINSYTVEKGGIKMMIHQTPLYTNGVFSGVIEISFEIPGEMPHFKRD